jgi:hypothetical protein
MGAAVKKLKSALGKPSNADIEYAIAAATRDMLYSNEQLKSLGWTDKKTAEYTGHIR